MVKNQKNLQPTDYVDCFSQLTPTTTHKKIMAQKNYYLSLWLIHTDQEKTDIRR